MRKKKFENFEQSLLKIKVNMKIIHEKKTLKDTQEKKKENERH